MKSEKSSSFITLNGRQISFVDIEQENVYPETEFEQDVLIFCRQWLQGEEVWFFKSSGSTGIPKNIPVKRAQMLASISTTAKALQLKPDDKALLCLPVANTGGKMMIARALHLNMQLECVEPTGNPLEKIIHIPDFMAVVPLQLERMISNPVTKEKLEKVGKIIVGGAPVDSSLRRSLDALKTPVYATYGMTETVSHIALQLLNTDNKEPYFQVLPNIIIDADDRDCIKVKGAVTDNQWIQTNDRIKLIEKDKFEWLGRTDLMINSGGIKLQPEVIEHKLKDVFDSLSISNSYFILGVPHSKLGQECTLFIEGNPLSEDQLENLQEKIKRNLSSYERPRSIHFLKEFVKTKSGKLDRMKSAALN